jgi:hypothetical protein
MMSLRRVLRSGWHSLTFAVNEKVAEEKTIQVTNTRMGMLTNTALSSASTTP